MSNEDAKYEGREDRNDGMDRDEGYAGKDDKDGGKGRGRTFFRKKICRFCKGMAKMDIGKQAMIAKAIMPNKIRIWLVVIFIAHLQCCAIGGRAVKWKSSPFRAMLQNCHIKRIGLKHK